MTDRDLRRSGAQSLLSVAAERVSAARWAVVRALIDARHTSGAGWQDAAVHAARSEFIRAGAAHAAARQLLQDVLAEELSS